MNRRGFFAALAGMALGPLMPPRAQWQPIKIEGWHPMMYNTIARIYWTEDYIVTKIDPLLEDCWVDAIRFRLTKGHIARERTLEDVELRKVVKIVPIV